MIKFPEEFTQEIEREANDRGSVSVDYYSNGKTYHVHVVNLVRFAQDAGELIRVYGCCVINEVYLILEGDFSRENISRGLEKVVEWTPE